jgi:hypothetical protein
MLFLWYNGWPIVPPAGWPVPFRPRGKTTTGGISFVGDDVEPVFILEVLPSWIHRAKGFRHATAPGGWYSSTRWRQTRETPSGARPAEIRLRGGSWM